MIGHVRRYNSASHPPATTERVPALAIDGSKIGREGGVSTAGRPLLLTGWRLAVIACYKSQERASHEARERAERGCLRQRTLSSETAPSPPCLGSGGSPPCSWSTARQMKGEPHLYVASSQPPDSACKEGMSLRTPRASQQGNPCGRCGHKRISSSAF